MADSHVIIARNTIERRDFENETRQCKTCNDNEIIDQVDHLLLSTCEDHTCLVV